MNSTTQRAVYDQYLESQVFSADPVQLVRMLYRGAMDAVSAARKHLAAGAIPERSRQITKAWEILHQLTRTLNHERGGDISRDLDALYAYMSTRLLEANVQQADEPLAEVEKLLGVLWEAWSSVEWSGANQVADRKSTRLNSSH